MTLHQRPSVSTSPLLVKINADRGHTSLSALDVAVVRVGVDAHGNSLDWNDEYSDIDETILKPSKSSFFAGAIFLIAVASLVLYFFFEEATPKIFFFWLGIVSATMGFALYIVSTHGGDTSIHKLQVDVGKLKVDVGTAPVVDGVTIGLHDRLNLLETKMNGMETAILGEKMKDENGVALRDNQGHEKRDGGLGQKMKDVSGRVESMVVAINGYMETDVDGKEKKVPGLVQTINGYMETDADGKDKKVPGLLQTINGIETKLAGLSKQIVNGVVEALQRAQGAAPVSGGGPIVSVPCMGDDVETICN